MSWFGVSIALTVPAAFAAIIALPFWVKGDPVIGNIVGAGLIFVGAIVMIFREYVEIQRVTMRCLQAGIVCSFSPEPFTRFAVYGLIALVEACSLFAISVMVEQRIRRRTAAPNWR